MLGLDAWQTENCVMIVKASLWYWLSTHLTFFDERKTFLCRTQISIKLCRWKISFSAAIRWKSPFRVLSIIARNSSTIFFPFAFHLGKLEIGLWSKTFSLPTLLFYRRSRLLPVVCHKDWRQKEVKSDNVNLQNIDMSKQTSSLYGTRNLLQSRRERTIFNPISLLRKYHESHLIIITHHKAILTFLMGGTILFGFDFANRIEL